MYEIVKKGVPFVLAGSIRDDGPLKDVDHGYDRGAEGLRRRRYAAPGCA